MINLYIVSVALVLASRRTAVSRYGVLYCPDFPLVYRSTAATVLDKPAIIRLTYGLKLAKGCTYPDGSFDLGFSSSMSGQLCPLPQMKFLTPPFHLSIDGGCLHSGHFLFLSSGLIIDIIPSEWAVHF